MTRFWSVIVDAVLKQTKGLAPDTSAVAVFPIVNLSKLKAFQNALLLNGGRLPRYMVSFLPAEDPIVVRYVEAFPPEVSVITPKKSKK